MNEIETALSATADFFETQLSTNPELLTQLKLLVGADQSPHVLRVLRDLPDSGLLIRIEPRLPV